MIIYIDGPLTEACASLFWMTLNLLNYWK